MGIRSQPVLMPIPSKPLKSPPRHSGFQEEGKVSALHGVNAQRAQD